MNLTVELPDAIAHRLQLDGPDAQRHALELFALRGYESGKLSRRQVGDLLGLSFYDAEGFLKENGAVLPMTIEDVYREARALQDSLKQ